MRSLFLIGIVALILGVTNPSEAEYKEWFTNEMKDRSDSDLMDFGIDLFGPNYVEKETSYTNYILFSLYKTQLPGPTEVTTVGIFNHFFFVSKSQQEQEAKAINLK
ncbi:DUF4359 domain-containing protein [Pontibacillus marinus]|uniref:DUF4359 domain-containing protein n=1 Tax=Pontibacillus marinus BH030004 = DSM 16465 TaxID=1385511 RepID=A0A0A5GFN9_9BACI|nr:DUF4359 domain-containing protein [Pontibacillus marinus]KGX89940.1 hypothetical protein N783_03280 [Pontibacillus marinus BH030004 = DSM 16465]